MYHAAATHSKLEILLLLLHAIFLMPKHLCTILASGSTCSSVPRAKQVNGFEAGDGLNTVLEGCWHVN